MGDTEKFYVEMAKAIKARDHATMMVARWQAQVTEAEAWIESLIVTQHVDKAAEALTEPTEVS
jgi:hypothetical protein